jgi:hypothetical protein
MIIDNLENHQFAYPLDFYRTLKNISHVIWGKKEVYSLNILPTKDFLMGKKYQSDYIKLYDKNTFLVEMSQKVFFYYYEDIIFHVDIRSLKSKITISTSNYPGFGINYSDSQPAISIFDPNRKIDEPDISYNIPKDQYYITHNFIRSILAIYQIFPNQFLEFYEYSFDELMEYLKIKKNSEMYKQLWVHTVTNRLIK